MVGIAALAMPTGLAQAQWIQASQERVVATSKVMNSIKWIKISGLSNPCFDLLRRLRVKEIAVSLRFRLLMGASMILSKLPYISASGPQLTLYSCLRPHLDPNLHIFTLRQLCRRWKCYRVGTRFHCFRNPGIDDQPHH